MRGGKSDFSCLLAVAAGARRVHLLRRVQARPGPTETKKDKVFAVDASKIEEIEVHAASGETTTLKKAGTDWEIVAPEAVDGRRGDSRHARLDARVARGRPRRRREPGVGEGVRPRAAAEQHRLQARGRDGVPQAQPRRQDADRRSDLYARVEGQPKLFLIAAFNSKTRSTGRRSICATRRSSSSSATASTR